MEIEVTKSGKRLKKVRKNTNRIYSRKHQKAKCLTLNRIDKRKTSRDQRRRGTDKNGGRKMK